MGNIVSQAQCEEEHEDSPPAEEIEDQAAEDKSSDEGEEGGAEAEEEGEEEHKPDVHVETVPYDFRFPGINQARNCYTRYNEFYKCKANKSEDDAECKRHQRAYRSICPGEWVEKWNEARESGTWFGKY